MSSDNRSRSPSPTPGDYPSSASTDNHGREHVSRRTTLPSTSDDDAGGRSDGDASPADPAYTRPVPSDSSTQDAPSIRWADESVIGWHRDVEQSPCAANVSGHPSDQAITYLKEHKDDAVGGAPPLRRVVPPDPKFEAYLKTVNGTELDPVIVTVEPEPKPKAGVVTVTERGFTRRIPQGKETQKELARRRVQEWQEPWI